MKPKKILSFILGAAMAISMLPTFTPTASAATAATEKNITLGTDALSGYDSENNSYKYIYYGTYNSKPIKWRILTMNGNDGTYYGAEPYTPTQAPTEPVDGTIYTDSDKTTKFIYLAKGNAYYKQQHQPPMFLLSEYALKEMEYELAWNSDDSDGQNKPSDWRYSDVWNWCNNTDDNTSFISTSFTDSEKAYLLKTSKANCTDGYTDELKGDTFFLLSHKEVENDYIKDNRKAQNSSGSDAKWWLRSPDGDSHVECVLGDGSVDGYVLFYNVPAARPAFNLDSSKILFTSAAKGGKASTAAGGELSKNASFDSLTDNDSRKLTIKREYAEGEAEFSATQTGTGTKKGETLTFRYENAKTGANEYISAMIVNETDGKVSHYSRLANAAEASSGTVEFKIPTDIALGNHKVMLFNEQINGDYKTDFSSDFVAFDLTVTLKGEGTAAKPYLIYNLSDLKDFRDAVNSGTSYEGKYIRLMNNIDMSAEYGEGKQSWTPIGRSSGKAFNGTFDGNKFEIRNLYINTHDEDNLGLFGCIESSAVIKTLGVTGSVNAKTTTFVGGLAGQSKGTITDCYNHSTISTDGNATLIGGVVGFMGGGSVTNCYNVGKVNGTSSVGGIVGSTIAVSGDIIGITGCYYLTDAAAVGIGSNGDVAGCAEAKTAEQFASGEVAYALQQGTKNDTDNETGGIGNDIVDIPVTGTTAGTATDTTIGMPTIAIDPQIWGQKIGTDKYPTFQYEAIHEDEYNGVKVYRNKIDGFKILLLGADKKSATAVLNAAGAYTIVFADYEDNRLVNVEALEVTVDKAQAVRVASDKEFTLGTGDKIMLWDDFEKLTPMCGAYEVK